MARGPEPEERGRIAERLGEIGHGRDPDSAGDEQRPRHRQVEAVAERAEDVDRVSGIERAERARARADRVDEESELARRGDAEAHGPREQPSGRLQHEELARDSGHELAALEAEQRVRPDPLVPDHREPLSASFPSRK
jgi:hypothetical protein